MQFAAPPLTMLRRSLLWAGPLLLAITVFVVPVTGRLMKTGQLLLLAGTLLVWLLALRRERVVFFSLLACTALAAGLFLLPTQSQAARAGLAHAFTQALQRYDGVTYWWGGESARGIDCSGLIRRGMMDAAFLEGLKHLDGSLLRFSADLWWHDCSAEALGDGHRGYTMSLRHEPSLNSIDPATLQPGDLAITGGGSHILAHLGGGCWIQADPTVGKVTTETAPSRNGWFQGKVHLVRWTLVP